MIAPINIQREFPDIIPAPFRTNGESEVSGAVALSCASIVLINRSGGSWFGTSCIQLATASCGPPLGRSAFSGPWAPLSASSASNRLPVHGECSLLFVERADYRDFAIPRYRSG